MLRTHLRPSAPTIATFRPSSVAPIIPHPSLLLHIVVPPLPPSPCALGSLPRNLIPARHPFRYYHLFPLFSPCHLFRLFPNDKNKNYRKRKRKAPFIMPRRARRGNTNETSSGRTASSDQAVSARIHTIFKKIIATLQDQRDLRCDLSSTRTRALLLDSEYVVLHSEYEKSLAARDKLEALSRELTRQNKTIDEESENRVMQERKMREEIVHRFNVAMMDINKKLARQSTNREQRDKYVQTLQNKLTNLRERYDTRQQHFTQQLHRKRLEKQLSMAREREVLKKHKHTSEDLSVLREQLAKAQTEHDFLADKLEQYRSLISDGEDLLESTQDVFDQQKKHMDHAQEEVKHMQNANATVRNANNATNIHIKAMEAECKRLETSINEMRDVERKERAKVEALEKLCRQVTCERSELHSEILVMQDAWTNLKLEIDALKDQVGEGGKVFDVLQSIMNRESLDVAVSGIIKSGKTIEDVINDELSHLRLTSGVKLDGKRTVVQSTATTANDSASSAHSAESPG